MFAVVCFVVPSLFTYLLVTNSEPLKDRMVVREGNSRNLRCPHKFGNSIALRWDYISNSSKNVTIYDSKQDTILTNNFEVVCHHNYCSLKLIRAKVEDSGIYMCSVGELKDNNNWKPIIEIELVIKGPSKEVIVTNVGNFVTLPCEHNLKNVTRTRWTHLSADGVHIYNLYDMGSNEQLHSNYEALCGFHQLFCNIKILGVDKESAGRYVCMHGDSMEYERRYGLDDMTDFIEIDLVVGDLICNDYNRGDLTMIGENDCYGVEPDFLNLKCSFSYYGNIDYNLFHPNWIERHKFNFVEKNLISSQVMHENAQENMKIISIQTNLSVTHALVNSTFQCILDNTNVTPCGLSQFEIKYVRNTTERSPSMYSSALQKIKCFANKSENMECSYHWVHNIGGATIEFQNETLLVENMETPGNYVCYGSCRLKSNERCLIRAREFEVIRAFSMSAVARGHPHMSIFIGLISVNCIIITTITLVIVLRIFFRIKGPKKINKRTEGILWEREYSYKELFQRYKDDEDLYEEECTLQIVKEKKFEGRVEALALYGNVIFISFEGKVGIETLSYPEFKWRSTFVLRETMISSLLAFDDTLYFTAYCLNEDGLTKIFKIDAKDGLIKGESKELYAFDLDRHAISKSYSGNVLLMHGRNIVHLSKDGDVLSSFDTMANVYGTLLFRENRYLILCEGAVHIIDEHNRCHASYLPSTEHDDLSAPRCLTCDQKYAYILDRLEFCSKILKVNLDLKVKSAFIIRKRVEIYSYDELRKAFVVIVGGCDSKLLIYRTPTFLNYQKSNTET